MSSVNITVLDQSPTWVYFPDREGASNSSWQSSWTGSADSSYDPTHTQSNIASGSSAHFTSFAGASAKMAFTGSAITLYGQGTAGAYTTTLDGKSPVTGSPSGPVLATYGGLNETAQHTLLLTSTKAQNLSLSYATFTIQTNVPVASVVNTTQIAVSSGTNDELTTNPFFSTSGAGFSNQHTDSGPGGNPYTRIDSNSPGALISFTCSQTSALFVYGTTNWNHQTFSVEIDPPAGASQGVRTFNGTSKWFVLNNLLFWEGGMDPDQTYQVKITNLVAGSYTDTHSVVMMNLPSDATASKSGSSSKSTSGATPSSTGTPSTASGVGKTVGIAVGAVAALAAVILFAFICRRRRAKGRRNNNTGMTIDGMMITPFGGPAKDLSLTGSETPLSLSNFPPHGAYGDYPNSSHGDFPSSSSYGGGYAGGYATKSGHERDRSAAGIAPRGAHYSELSRESSDDFNPYVDRPSAAYRESSYVGSSSGSASGSRPQSGVAGPSGQSSGLAQAAAGPQRRPEKGQPPSDAASTRPVRHEVDAGRVPDEEETLPPSYGAWTS